MHQLSSFVVHLLPCYLVIFVMKFYTVWKSLTKKQQTKTTSKPTKNKQKTKTKLKTTTTNQKNHQNKSNNKKPHQSHKPIPKTQGVTRYCHLYVGWANQRWEKSNLRQRNRFFCTASIVRRKPSQCPPLPPPKPNRPHNDSGHLSIQNLCQITNPLWKQLKTFYFNF